MRARSGRNLGSCADTGLPTRGPETEDAPDHVVGIRPDQFHRALAIVISHPRHRPPQRLPNRPSSGSPAVWSRSRSAAKTGYTVGSGTLQTDHDRIEGAAMRLPIDARRGGLAAIAACAILVSACSEAFPSETSSGDTGAVGTPGSVAQAGDDQLATPTFSVNGWATDFSRHAVELGDIIPGGPPRDGIPSIDAPQFISIAEARRWLARADTVQVLSIDGDVRAYPTQILLWHEIVNDEVGGISVAITYCPLCNTAIVFDRRLSAVGTVELGVSGNLYQSAMVMYDRTTETWFWQVNGTGIVGELTGIQFQMLPSTLTSFGEFQDTHPGGLVLSRDTGFDKTYGRNPYPGYDSGQSFTLPRGAEDPLPAMERVVTFGRDGSPVAVPFSTLAETPVIHHEVDGVAVVVFYRAGTASPLQASNTVQGRDIGSAAVYEARVDDLQLTFEAVDGGFRDRETGTTWSLLGLGLDGTFAGTQLVPVIHANHFWFSWVTYRPDTLVLRGKE